MKLFIPFLFLPVSWFTLHCDNLEFEVVNAMWVKVNGRAIELNYYDECSNCECWTVIYELKPNPEDLRQVRVCHQDSLITLCYPTDTTTHKYTSFTR